MATSTNSGSPSSSSPWNSPKPSSVSDNFLLPSTTTTNNNMSSPHQHHHHPNHNGGLVSMIFNSALSSYHAAVSLNSYHNHTSRQQQQDHSHNAAPVLVTPDGRADVKYCGVLPQQRSNYQEMPSSPHHNSRDSMSLLLSKEALAAIAKVSNLVPSKPSPPSLLPRPTKSSMIIPHAGPSPQLQAVRKSTLPPQLPLLPGTRMPPSSSSSVPSTSTTATPIAAKVDHTTESSTSSHHHQQQNNNSNNSTSFRLNKFVRRLHDMLQAEKNSGIVEWRRGLLVLCSTDAFAKKLLPKYFNTRNFKTFRRQLNYYGFVHVRSFSTTGSTTTALWVNRGLAKDGSDEISSVLRLRRVEPCEAAKTVEGRRHRKELAIHTVEEDIGVSAKSLQLEQIRSMALRGDDFGVFEIMATTPTTTPVIATTTTRTTTVPTTPTVQRKAVLVPPPQQPACQGTCRCQEPLSSSSSPNPPIPTEVHIPTDSSSCCSSQRTTATRSHQSDDTSWEDYHHTTTTQRNTTTTATRRSTYMMAESLDDASSTGAANLLLLLSKS